MEREALKVFSESLERDLLMDHLLQEEKTRIDNVLRVLSIQDASGRTRLIWRGLSSSDARQRANGVEALTHVANRALTTILIPLVEELPLEEKLKAGRKTFAFPELREKPSLIAHLIAKGDWVTSLLALSLAAKDGYEGLDPKVLASLAASENPWLSEAALRRLDAPFGHRQNEDQGPFHGPEQGRFCPNRPRTSPHRPQHLQDPEPSDSRAANKARAAGKDGPPSARQVREQNIIFSIGIFVAMVPEGLLPTLTLALVLAAQRMARRNVLSRHLPSVETLGSTTVICTDKTGALTDNRMRVVELMLGLETVTTLDLDQRTQLADSHKEFFRAANRCHSLEDTSQIKGGALLGDPMEVALVEMARRFLPGSSQPRRCCEAPFDSRRMRQSVAFEDAEGFVLYCKGAPETVLPLCTDLLSSSGSKALDPKTLGRILEAQGHMAENGLRVLALAVKTLPDVSRPPSDLSDLEEGLTFLGLAGLEDPPRAEVPDAVRKCQEAGIKVIMVTGDHPRTAEAIARKIGLIRSARPRIITGEEVRRLSAIQLQLALDAPEIHFARLVAAQKMRIVNALKKKDHVVAVTGDGVNDAPAFKAAHIGIAMGRSGVDVAKESADMVLLDDNFASIVNAVEEGRAIFQNIRKFLAYVLVHNVAELVPYLAFALFRIPLPLTPIQILAVDMGTDTLTALGLGVESPDLGVMRQPPRPKAERLLNRAVAMRAYLFLGIIEASALMGAYFFVLRTGGSSYGQMVLPGDLLYSQATTASLGAIIVMQIVNVFLCRSEVRSVFSMPFTDNRLIVGGVALELAFLLLFVYTPWGNLLLETSPLPGCVWLFLLPFRAGMLFLEEGRKWVVRRLRHQRNLDGSKKR